MDLCEFGYPFKLSYTIKLGLVSPHEATSSLCIEHLLTPVMLSLIIVKYQTFFLWNTLSIELKNLILGLSNNLNPEKLKFKAHQQCADQSSSLLCVALLESDPLHSVDGITPIDDGCNQLTPLSVLQCRLLTSHINGCYYIICHQSAHEKSQIFFKS